mmetsp:Transcript_3279/g.5753  ORF Transcript_3279/g.5753 Transcript_3279/m.5753 type:complete len:262 (+) Transcript_3279:41-826(+)
MANRTDPLARRAHGGDPQQLIEKTVRERIYSSRFWKEQCFGLDVAGVISVCLKTIDFIGGTVFSGNVTPCPFLCILLKLLQLGPDEDVALQLIEQVELKYVRALGIFYHRLVSQPVNVYIHLEPMLSDFRKVRVRNADGVCRIMCMDEYVERLFFDEEFVGIKLPRLPRRDVVVQSSVQLSEYESGLWTTYGMKKNEVLAQLQSVSNNTQQDVSPKTKRARTESKENRVEDEEVAAAAQVEGSTEYWNKLRSELGLKPLKE